MNSYYLARTLTLAAVLGAGTGCAVAGGPKNPCGLVETQRDAFAGTTRGFTLREDHGVLRAIGLHEAEGGFKLKLIVIQPGQSSAVSAAGDAVEIAINSTIVAVRSQKAVQPVVSYLGILTHWTLEYPVTHEQAKELSRGPISAIKVHVGSETIQFSPDADQALRLRNSFACMTR